MSVTPIRAIALTLGLATSFGSQGDANSSLHARASAWLAVPAKVNLLVFADLRKLSQSALFRELPWRQRLTGDSRIETTCGFDPTSRLREIALFRSAKDELAFAASGAFDEESIATCAARVIEARGAEAVVTRVGSFLSVRDESGPSEIAVRDDGLVLVGEGSFLRTLIDTADGRLASGLLQPEIARLHATAAKADAVALLRHDLTGSSEPSAPSEAAELRTTQIQLTASRDPLELHATLDCRSNADCEGLERSLSQTAQRFERLLLGDAGSDPGQALDVSRTAGSLVVRLRISEAHARTLLTDALRAPSQP